MEQAGMQPEVAERHVPLRRADVFSPRSLGTLPLVEGHRLTLAELIEPHALAGGLMKEVLVAVAHPDEPKTLVTHDALDCSSRIRHLSSPSSSSAHARRAGPVPALPPQAVSCLLNCCEM